MNDFQDFGPLVDRGRSRADDTFPRAIPPRRMAAQDHYLHEAARAGATIRRRRRKHSDPEIVWPLLEIAVVLFVFAIVVGVLIS